MEEDYVNLSDTDIHPLLNLRLTHAQKQNTLKNDAEP
mgnify:CR=1 FL=1